MSKVRVNMSVCGKSTVISVKQNDDGDFEIEVETDCNNVREFIEMLGRLTLTDIADKPNSRIWECFKKAKMSSTCLCPAGVINAAWLEAGMLSKNLALSKGKISIDYLE
ncbi:MAG: hypothetical protein QW087_07460 [Methanomassiliicoccales archaeon]